MSFTADGGAALSPFDFSEREDIVARWDQWKERFKRLMRLMKITDDNLKIDALFVYGGAQLELFHEPFKHLDHKTAELIVEAISEKIKPVNFKRMNLVNFRAIEQYDEESFDEFVNRLRAGAKAAELGTRSDEEIANQIVMKCRSRRLRERALAKEDATLDEIIKWGRIDETVEKQVERMNGASGGDINRIQNDKRTSRREQANRSSNQIDQCRYCGQSHPRRQCPAFGKTCSGCGKKNHFERVCRSKGKSEPVKKISTVNI